MTNRNGIAIVPIVAIIAAILAFGVTGYFFYSSLKNTNESAQTNTVVVNVNTNSTVAVNGNANGAVGTKTNANSNVNAATDAANELKTYTNTENGFSMRFPSSWVRRSEYDGSAMPIIDDNQAFSTFSEGGNSPVNGVTVTISDRTEGTIVHRNTASFWRIDKKVSKEETATINGATFTKFTLVDDAQEYYLLEHGTLFYQLTKWSGADEITSNVVKSFTLLRPGEKLTDIGSNLPFTSVTHLQALFGVKDAYSDAVVSVMGTRALVGGWNGKLFLYDGTAVKDISEKFKPTRQDLDTKNVIVRGIGNNGSYWLISSALSGEEDRLFKYDGKTWTELSESFHAAVPDIGSGGAQSLIWNGKYWLIGDNLGRLVRYDGKKFTDVTSLLFPEKNYSVVNDIIWNGKYFLISTGSNISTMYTYNGSTITALTGFGENNTIQRIGWNGSYWLLGALELPYYLQKYDGTKVTPLTVEGAGDVMDIAWVKPFWIVNNTIFDGTKFDTFSPLNGLSDRVSISTGAHMGIIVDNRGDIVRFDY